MRDLAAADFAGTLRRLAAIGFVGVELAGMHGMPASELAGVTADLGLVVSSAHVNSGVPAAEFEAALDDIERLGCNTVIMPFVPPAGFADIDAVTATATMLNEANTIAHSRGFTFGYHNHFWELQHQIDGRASLLHLYDRLSDDVIAELDIYWAAVGGADPIELLGQLGDRVRLLHVKDGPADDRTSANVAVGTGSINTAATLGAALGAAWHVVEFDKCDTDIFTAIELSYGFLVGSGLSRGRV